MINHGLRSAAAIIILFQLILSCSSKVDTPEGQIRALITKVEKAAEKEDIETIKPLVSDEYLDKQRRNKDAIIRLLQYYFSANRSIHLFTRLHEINFLEIPKIKVTVFVAMAGQRIRSAEELSTLRADLYRFDFTLINKGTNDWIVTNAEWRPANINDFF